METQGRIADDLTMNTGKLTQSIHIDDEGDEGSGNTPG